MQALIAIIGLIFVFIGFAVIIKPELLKKALAFFIIGNRIYLVGVIRLAIGAVFLIAAGRCAHPWLIIFLGILIIVSAVIVFAIKPAAAKKFVQFWLNRNNMTIRLVGLIPVIYGLFVCYAAVIK